MTPLFIQWKDPVTEDWYTVGKLTSAGNMYGFQYTEGALLSKRFVPFGRMASLQDAYVSEDLFPLFANRILNKSRPEYSKYLEWLNLEEDADPLHLLALSQGFRGTDNLRVYSIPSQSGHEWTCDFFVSGISHLASSQVDRVSELNASDSLYLMADIQNTFKNAITLRSDKPKALVGYCPSFLSTHMNGLLNDSDVSVNVSVVKINSDAPSPYRLLCNLKVTGIFSNSPFSSAEEEVISSASRAEQ